MRRKVSDVWNAVENQRPTDAKQRQWQHSYDGVKAALKHVDLELLTCRDELSDMAVPLDRRRRHNYNERKVIVTRAGRTSEPTAIKNLLSGHSGLLTDEERLSIHQRNGVAQSAKKPKGVAVNNNGESRAVDELDDLLGTTSFLHREHLWEFRLADVAYSLSCAANLAQKVWVGDQVKHSLAGDEGRCAFYCADSVMNVADMISYLNAGLSLTCIGKSDGKVDVVWFFNGEPDIKMLSQFDNGQSFQPILHLKVTSPNKFTQAYNAKHHRYDIGKSADECKRLLERKISAVRGGVKHTLEYLNEDDSQIPGPTHRVEQKAFALTRAACARISIDVNRLVEDAYGPVDFRVGYIARNQDKVFGGQVCMRQYHGHPYNPDDIDILQLTDLAQHKVYALPMRLLKDGQVESLFSETALMRQHLTCSAAWKEANKKYLYDLKDEAGIRAYVDACIAASQVPMLTDRKWYSNMLTANAEKFGSRHKSKARNAALQED